MPADPDPDACEQFARQFIGALRTASILLGEPYGPGWNTLPASRPAGVDHGGGHARLL
ncbi:hypothetical protein ACFSKW_26320 [Nonomuraea mangrovi]|uniref:Uncharacterized protein n=1 Tax=Nonomuraea mangrovi TaxID=2316207 RepID=A0ABW4T3J1_9ACTN